MEMRHTIEILVKDIQDIEKLVASLQNSPRWPAIEMDLALSKLRNVYEVLTMIRDDRHQAAATADVARPEYETRQAPPEPEVSRPEPQAEQDPSAPEPARTGPRDEHTFSAPEPARPETGPEHRQTDGDVADSGKMDSGKVAAILAEKFSKEASINENLANKRSTSMESRLAGKPIDNIARNIGINDRFLIIRELFDGNSEEYSRLIRNLDDAGNYDRALELIREKFATTMEHEGVTILMSLSKRRFVRV